MSEVGGEHDRLINDTASGMCRIMCDLTCLNDIKEFLNHRNNFILGGIFNASEVTFKSANFFVPHFY